MVNRLTKLLAIGTVVLALASPGMAQIKYETRSKDWNSSVSIDINWKEVWKGVKSGASWVKKRFFDKHKVEQLVYRIGSRRVVIIPLHPELDGSRGTFNVDLSRVWTKSTRATVYYANLPKNANPSSLRWALKKDRSWSSDPTLLESLRHGGTYTFTPGGSRYFAHRAGKEYRGSYIILVEHGVSRAKVEALPGIKVR